MGNQDLDYVFNPTSVAIVGVSTKGTGMQQASGAVLLEGLLSGGFKGRIYPVNPKGGQLSGLKVYENLEDITEPIDYVICGVPAPQVPQLIRDCVAKGVKAIHVITGGFSESDTTEGKQLEQEIFSLARQNGIRIIGPNCIGAYCPKTGISFSPDAPKESGPVSILCQSGGNCSYLVREGSRRGIRFSKVISYGNACDVDESDILEYFAADLDTALIMIYIEGVKNGQRFSQLLRETAKVKPVIVLKGGATEAGTRAVASHTGALAGSNQVWSGLLRQAGVIQVYSLEELVDMAVTFTFLPPLSGKKLGVIGFGGGFTVLATDDCVSAGLEVPRFPVEIRDKLRNYLKKGDVGVNLNNPVDFSDQVWDVFYDCCKVILGYGELDLVVFHMPAGSFVKFSPELRHGVISLVESCIKSHKESSTPMAMVTHYVVSIASYQLALECEQMCCAAGMPVYHSLSNAAKAIARFIDYHERRKRLTG